jgi:class 3 adenylate cyclase
MGAQRALTAIVFTDAVGFSAMASTDESMAFRLIEQDFALMRQLAAVHQGQALKTTGDGMLLVFGSAVQAATWSVDFQTRMRERAKAEPGPFFEHRIGLHVGDVLLSEDDAQGDGVNVAARLQSGAPGGGVWVSATAYDLIKSRTEFNLISRGKQDFKNIPAPIDVFEIPGDPSARSTEVAPKASPARNNNALLAGLGSAVVVLSIAVAAIALNRPTNTVTKVVPGERVVERVSVPLFENVKDFQPFTEEEETKTASSKPPTPPKPKEDPDTSASAALKAAETSAKADKAAAAALGEDPAASVDDEEWKAYGEGMAKDFEKMFSDSPDFATKAAKGLDRIPGLRTLRAFEEKVKESKSTYDFQAIIDYIASEKALAGNPIALTKSHWVRLEKLKTWMQTQLARTNEQSPLELPSLGRQSRTLWADGSKLVLQTGEEKVRKDLSELKPTEFAAIARILLKKEPSLEQAAQVREFEQEYNLVPSGPRRLRKN